MRTELARSKVVVYRCWSREACISLVVHCTCYGGENVNHKGTMGMVIPEMTDLHLILRYTHPLDTDFSFVSHINELLLLGGHITSRY